MATHREMRLGSRLIVSAVFTIVGVAAGCGSNLTAETTGEVTRVVLDRDRKTTKRKSSSNKTRKRTTTTYDTEIDYRYTVNGKTYEGFSEKDGDVQNAFQPGRGPFVICYNPSDPNESDVFPAGQKC